MAGYTYRGSGKDRAVNELLKKLKINPSALDSSGMGDRIDLNQLLKIQAKKKKKKKKKIG